MPLVGCWKNPKRVSISSKRRKFTPFVTFSQGTGSTMGNFSWDHTSVWKNHTSAKMAAAVNGTEVMKKTTLAITFPLQEHLTIAFSFNHTWCTSEPQSTWMGISLHQTLMKLMKDLGEGWQDCTCLNSKRSVLTSIKSLWLRTWATGKESRSHKNWDKQEEKENWLWEYKPTKISPTISTKTDRFQGRNFDKRRTKEEAEERRKGERSDSKAYPKRRCKST